MKYITVNLLGPEAPRQQGLALPVGFELDPMLFVIAIGGGILALGIPNLATRGVESYLSRPAEIAIQNAKQEIAKSVKGSEQLIVRQKELDNLEGDLRALQGLVDQSTTWASILEELRTITPTDLWITSLSTSAGRLEVGGAALDYRAIAYLYTNLQTAKYFDGPVLEDVAEQSDPDSGRSIITFSIQAAIITNTVGSQ